ACDDFERNIAPKVGIEGSVDLTHPADADEPTDLIVTQDPAGQRSPGNGRSNNGEYRRLFDETAGLGMRIEQPLDLGAQWVLSGTSGVQKSNAISRRPTER